MTSQIAENEKANVCEQEKKYLILGKSEFKILLVHQVRLL